MAEFENVPLQEFCVHLENTTIRLLIGERWKKGEEDAEQVPVPHTHACSELFVCGTGEVMLQTEDGLLPLHAGDAAIVPPGVYHRKHHTTPDAVGYALSFLCIQKNRKECSDLYKTFLPFAEGKRILVWRSQPVFFESVEKILRQAQTARDFSPALSMAQLLMQAAQLPLDTAEPPSAAQPKTASPFDDMRRIMGLEHLVESCYMQDWKAEDIAKQFYISTRQLDRIVRKRYGKTLHEVLMDKRIQIAQRLLLTTDHTVDKIAVTVGFSTSAGFYREFSRRCGITPGAYRRDFQQPK